VICADHMVLQNLVHRLLHSVSELKFTDVVWKTRLLPHLSLCIHPNQLYHAFFLNPEGAVEMSQNMLNFNQLMLCSSPEAPDSDMNHGDSLKSHTPDLLV